MDKKIKDIFPTYNLNIICSEQLDDGNDTFKITDHCGTRYFLKLYGNDGGNDFMPNENIYHTYEQINLEMEILSLLSSGALNTAVPFKNKANDWVTILETSDGSPLFATVTSFIDASMMEKLEFPLTEMAYYAGVAAAQFHMESVNKLQSIASSRPHKRQDYMRRILKRLALGVEAGTLSPSQYDLLNQCGEVVLNCMNQLDSDTQYNVGLVHTDIRSANCLYLPKKIIPIDFSRSVYSYYLYDLGEMCAHIGGTEIQREILRGYHRVKPFRKGQLFMVQVFFVMFLMMVMAETITVKNSSWRDDVLKRFVNEFYPCLTSEKGFFEPFALEGIIEV